MKKLLLCGAILSLTGCGSYVEPGYVGVKVNFAGSSKGVDSEELSPGRYWIGMNEQLYTFPTFSQSMVWTKNPTEGSSNDDSMTFQTAEGMSVNSDVGITYSIDPKKVTVIFQKYRKGVQEITDIYLRSMVRDAIVQEASKLPMETLYGKGKGDFIKAVEVNVKAQTVDIGIIVEKIYLVGELRLPQTIIDSINMKIKAAQTTMQREQEVAQSRAEADKLEATARGEANASLLLAKAEAESIRIKGKALSENPKLVELSAIEKWNGVLPQYQLSGTTPFINLNE